MLGRAFDANHYFKKLSDDDKRLVKSVGVRAFSPTLNVCMAERKTAAARYLVGIFSDEMNPDILRGALATALRLDAPESFDWALGFFGFNNFGSTYSVNMRELRQLTQDVVKKGDVGFLEILYKHNRAAQGDKYASLDTSELLGILLTAKWQEGMDFCLARTPRNDNSTFAFFLSRPEDLPPALLEHVLGWARKFDDVQNVLDKALATACESLHADAHITLLLSRKADPNHGQALPVLNAALRGDHPLVDKLAAAGARLDLHGDAVIWRLLQKGAAPEDIDRFTRRMAQAVQESRYQMISPDVLAESLPLPEGGRLLSVFNFSARQQIVTVERAGILSAPTVRSFDDIEDRSMLADMRMRLTALGGTPPDIEGARLDKPVVKLSAPPSPAG